MGKKKIIFISDSYHSGGAEKIMEELVNHLPRDQFRITVRTPKPGEDFHKYYAADILYMRSNPLSCKIESNYFPLRVLRWLCKKIENAVQRRKINAEYDVAVSFKEGPTLNYVAKLKCPVRISWVHINYNAAHWTERYYASRDEERKTMQSLSAVVCVSDSVKQGVIDHVGDPGNLVVRMNPLDEKSVQMRSQEAVEDLPFSEGKTNILCVGRLNYAKGYDRLIHVVNKLKFCADQFNIFIIGEGEERKNIEALLQEYGITNVYLMGRKDNPYPYMKKADWILCASIFEGFCTVLQEAVILHKAFLSTKVGGAMELAGELGAGIMCDNSEDGLYEGLMQILNHPEVRHEYEKKSAVAACTISIDRCINNIIPLFYR